MVWRMIASCGVLLMMAGEKGHRYLTQNTSVMSHQYSWADRKAKNMN